MDPVEVKLENMTSYTEALILINRIKNKNDWKKNKKTSRA
jgi:hypothetical protein